MLHAGVALRALGVTSAVADLERLIASMSSFPPFMKKHQWLSKEKNSQRQSSKTRMRKDLNPSMFSPLSLWHFSLPRIFTCFLYLSYSLPFFFFFLLINFVFHHACSFLSSLSALSFSFYLLLSPSFFFFRVFSLSFVFFHHLPKNFAYTWRSFFSLIHRKERFSFRVSDRYSSTYSAILIVCSNPTKMRWKTSLWRVE